MAKQVLESGWIWRCAREQRILPRREMKLETGESAIRLGDGEMERRPGLADTCKSALASKLKSRCLVDVLDFWGFIMSMCIRTFSTWGRYQATESLPTERFEIDTCPSATVPDLTKNQGQTSDV